MAERKWPCGISDDEVLRKAFLDNRILITSDKDFGEMIFKSRRKHCGILLLRLINEKPTKKINVLENILRNYHQDLRGNFVVASEETVRIIKIQAPAYQR